MSHQQQLLKQELTIPEVLREYGKKFRSDILIAITEDCAIGVIMSYHGWDGKDDSQSSRKLLGSLIALRQAGIDRNLIEMNDSGFTFNEIADYLDRTRIDQ
jgi:hypothetical protein